LAKGRGGGWHKVKELGVRADTNESGGKCAGRENMKRNVRGVREKKINLASLARLKKKSPTALKKEGVLKKTKLFLL